jgi:histidine triad (HIT) family protein
MDGCIFCDIAARRQEASFVYEDEQVVSFMDIFPWRPGHLLVIPRAHGVRLADLRDGASAALFSAGTRIAAGLRQSGLPCDDVHLLLNDGAAANQTVPHAHLHVIPRVRGDLWRLALQLLRRPTVTLWGPAPRAVLDRQAEAIRAAIER